MILRLKSVQHEGGDVYSYSFTPNTPISWQAGQSIRLEFDTLTGSIERRFTISSAPFEGTIAATTRRTDSPFKQRLHNLPVGDAIQGGAIQGTFTWEDDEPAVLVAGGIGITPFYAMLKQRQHDNMPLNAHLVYVNSDAHIIFKAEIDALCQQRPEFTVHYVSRTEALPTLQDAPIADKPVFISGTSAMVDDISAALLKHKLAAASQLKRDWFTGYATVE